MSNDPKIEIGIEKVGIILDSLKFGTADSPRGRGRTVRQRTADGPPVLGRFYQRQFQSVGSVKIQRRTVRQDIADSPRLDRKVGSARLDLNWMSLSLSPTKPHISSKRLSLFLSQARGGDNKVKPFWSGSRTVRAHPRTLLKIVHHVLSVFQ